PNPPNYTPSLHDALPICPAVERRGNGLNRASWMMSSSRSGLSGSIEKPPPPMTTTARGGSSSASVGTDDATLEGLNLIVKWRSTDRKSTRLNSSHQIISY